MLVGEKIPLGEVRGWQGLLEVGCDGVEALEEGGGEGGAKWRQEM